MELEMKEEESMKSKWIIMFPFPFQGHQNPMFHLSNLLYSKGFSIHIIHTNYHSPNPSSHPHLTFHFIEDGFAADNPPNPSSASLPILTALNANCLEPFRACLDYVLGKAAIASSKCCLITDAMWGFVSSIANGFDVPNICLRTGSVSSFLLYDSIPLFKQKGYYPLQEAKLDDPIPELPLLRFRDLPPEKMHDLFASIVKESKSSVGMICNSFEEFESYSISTLRQSLGIPIFPIGPLHKHSPFSYKSDTSAEHKATLTWLNTQEPNSVLYVSLGSLVVVSEPDFHEIAWGLANSKQPFLWVARPGLVQGSDPSDPLPLPDGYMDAVAERGKLVKWAPQQEVLSHPNVGGFWTHCGWNSTVESVSEGVPMICQPFFGDQAVNTKFLSESLRIGLQIRTPLKRGEIEEVIRRLMQDEEGKEMRKRAADLKEKATIALMEGGSSQKSLDALTSYLFSLT